jgi:hypothetical protein
MRRVSTHSRIAKDQPMKLRLLSLTSLALVASTIACTAPVPVDPLNSTSSQEQKSTNNSADDSVDKDSPTTKTPSQQAAVDDGTGGADPQASFVECVKSTGGQLGAQAAQALDCEAACTENDTACSDKCWATVDAQCQTNDALCTSLDTAMQNCDTQFGTGTGTGTGTDPGTGTGWGTGTGTGTGNGWNDGYGGGGGGGGDDW